MSTPQIMRAEAEQTVLVVVDVQEKLFPLMQEKEVLAERIRILMRGAHILGLPILITEQYKKGLGGTIPELAAAAPADVVEKSSFSCFGDEGFRRALRDTERRQVVLCGIETHICVLQTGLDALAEGYEVFCVTDACSTRLAHAGAVGTQRLMSSGAVPTTTEGILFELMKRCDTEAFKAILPLVREGR